MLRVRVSSFLRAGCPEEVASACIGKNDENLAGCLVATSAALMPAAVDIGYSASVR
jgi:hypothetical protein